MYNIDNLMEKLNYEFDINILCLSLFNNKELCNYIVEHNIIWEYYDVILKNKKIEKLFNVINILYFNTSNLSIINRGMYKLLSDYNFSHIDYNSILYFFSQSKYYSYFNKTLIEIFETEANINYNNEFIICLFNDTKYLNLCIKYLDKILENVNDIFYIKNNTKNEIIKNYILKYIANNENKVVAGIIKNAFELNDEELKEENIFLCIKLIINELLQHEKKSINDIDFIGKGATSCVYSIGDKILKLGRYRFTLQIPNNKRFLQPLLRRYILRNNMTDILGIIEITEKVDTKNISLDDVFEVYSSLRDDGLVWTDLNPKNVGRLIKDNKVYFDNLNPSMNAINYTTDMTEILKSGELILLDNDFIYKEDEYEFDDKLRNLELVSLEINTFEKKYQEKKKKTINL